MTPIPTEKAVSFKVSHAPSSKNGKFLNNSINASTRVPPFSKCYVSVFTLITFDKSIKKTMPPRIWGQANYSNHLSMILLYVPDDLMMSSVWLTKLRSSLFPFLTAIPYVSPVSTILLTMNFGNFFT